MRIQYFECGDAIEIRNGIMLKRGLPYMCLLSGLVLAPSPKQIPVVWIAFKSDMWQTCVEIKDYSVAYIEHIAVFEVSYH